MPDGDAANARRYTYMYVYIYIYVQTYAHTHTHKCAYAHTRTHTYTHTLSHTHACTTQREREVQAKICWQPPAKTAARMRQQLVEAPHVNARHPLLEDPRAITVQKERGGRCVGRE